tara:strand:- start:139 stop:579 length:441 start_codon:yes stop_codon:yes gene_type:complete
MFPHLNMNVTPVEMRLSVRDIPAFIETGVVLQVPEPLYNINVPSRLGTRRTTYYGRLKDRVSFFKIAKKRLVRKHVQLKKTCDSIIRKINRYERQLTLSNEKVKQYQKRKGNSRGLAPGYYKFRNMYFNSKKERVTQTEAIRDVGQ